MEVTPYLMFNGNCEEALNFYAKVLNGEVKDLMRFEGSPVEGMSEDKQKVLHSNFVAGNVFFMASDAGQPAEGNSPVYLSLNFDSQEEQERVFNGLAEGGKVIMPLDDAFWGARFGMLTDRFGINWMFNYDKNQKKQ